MINIGNAPLINFNEPQQIIILDEATLRKVIGEEVGKALHQVKNETPEPYSRAEAMKQLHCSEATLWQMQNNGTLHPIKVGRKVLFDRQEVNNLIQQKVIKKPKVAIKTATDKGTITL